MAKTFHASAASRMVNSVYRTMTRLGAGAAYRQVLTVPGRKTGRLYSTPVDVIELDGSQWLVAAYGPADWVRNALAAKQVTLSRGGTSQRFAVTTAALPEVVPVLRKYITEIRVTRPYFDAAPDAPDEAIAAELPRHPVLRLTPQP
jgi:deazaflavin-dependent oxidoreductase (nitroreductase family)